MRLKDVSIGRITKRNFQMNLQSGKMLLQSGSNQLNIEYTQMITNSNRLEVLSTTHGLPSVLKNTILSNIQIFSISTPIKEEK